MSYEQEKQIYTTLIEGGLTPEGAAGAMGNMFAESTLIPNIAQRGMTTLSDEAYTAAADSHNPASDYQFIHDSVGYGLCQWTSWDRKENLLKFAKELGTSIGDLRMQVLFFLKELKSYPKTLNILTTSHDLKQCSDIVCTDFERPAFNNLDARYRYSLEFYNKFKDLAIPGLNAPSTEPAYIPEQKLVQTDESPVQSAFNAQNLFSNLITGIASKIVGKKVMNNAQMPVLKEGDQGPGVAAIQVALKYHKVDLGTTGTLGIWESGTTTGVKAFQATNDIPVTGQMDGPTWSKLMQ